MLVLTRKSQDSIRIGDHIKVTVLRIKGNTVRIGVEAPEDVRIVRGELPHFGDPSENSDNSSIEVAAIRKPAAGLGVEPATADTGSNQDVLERGAASRMPASSRQKPYLPARTNKDTQRSHPLSGNRLPSENISVSGTGLPLPPR
jgi:carbon storage regulator CsrA